MWIVRLALRRPYTFVVMALLIFILGPLVILRTPTDIFPNIDIPVVSVIWNYTRPLGAEEMANRIVTSYERALTTTVNDIEHIESQSLNGIAVVKIFFQPKRAHRRGHGAGHGHLADASCGRCRPARRRRSSSATAPRACPILQLALSGQGLSEQQLFDLGNNFIRTQLATVQGAAIPYPYGGKQRQIQVDLDLARAAVARASRRRRRQRDQRAEPDPAGRHGEDRRSSSTTSRLNSSPTTIDGAERPADQDASNGTTIYIRDVAHVRDGYRAADQHRARRRPARRRC